MGIKDSLEDPHGVLDNWDGDAVDPCSWTMVTCSSENLVIKHSAGVPVCGTNCFKLWLKLVLCCFGAGALQVKVYLVLYLQA